jgi:hypothetical protein
MNGIFRVSFLLRYWRINGKVMHLPSEGPPVRAVIFENLANSN